MCAAPSVCTARVGEGMASKPPAPPGRVLRVSQLDALELDRMLEQLLWEQLGRCFQAFRPGLLVGWEPELRALLRLLLWRFTLYSSEATVGQALLNIRYSYNHGGRHVSLSRRQKLWFAALTVGGGWASERWRDIYPRGGGSDGASAHHADGGVGGAMGAAGGGLGYRFVTGGGAAALFPRLKKAAGTALGLLGATQLLAYVVFLRTGTGLSLTERLLGLNAVQARPQGLRQVGFEYMNRELLWHGFAEFLLFVLPLVNAARLRFSPTAHGRAGGAKDPAEAATVCVACGEWPCLPHTAGGCAHVFCYHCLASRQAASADLACPRCGSPARRMLPLRVAVPERGRVEGETAESFG
ncbi:peroxisome biogenesis factor 2 isoform X1 [Petromyzon marinus]|uniref:Peroxisome biogenesis factor 2 n=2 Tax=Petromyzon marinus TaxID=7757 RepID=A0AAJ7XA03_PETMA|nr:peroxisome biogenesis factor 2 isoform X1 [Petromyzon marinus]